MLFAWACWQPPAVAAAAAPERAPAQEVAPAGRADVALTQFDLEGDGKSAALALQLQDGFVLGLFRAGIPALDPVDVERKLPGSPELQGCDTSPCLKLLGQRLDVRFVLRVKVQATSNSYRMTARLFSTEGAIPAVIPVETQSRFCDVCTVAEARDVMVRLAGGIKKPLQPVEIARVISRRPPRRTWSTHSTVAVVLGVVAIFAGAGLLAGAADEDGRQKPAFAGGLMGAGVALATCGLYSGFDTPAASSAPSYRQVGLALRW